jgi:hypothetical protein
MAAISEFKALFGDWIVAVTGAIDEVASRLVSVRRILLVEGDDGAFRTEMIPTCHFASKTAGLIHRYRRTGRAPFAAVVLSCNCNQIMS